MVLSARQFPRGKILTCDVCIVGTGAAGIALAHELRNTNIEVLLLESGGIKFEADTQELYKGEVVDPYHHGPLEHYRQRRFGGTMEVWGGRCAPFDGIDFEERPYVPYSGWPISKADLDPYYKRSHTYLELGEYSYCVEEIFPDEQVSLIPRFKTRNINTDKIWRFSPPTNMRKAYFQVLKGAHNITICLYANCLKLETNRNGNSVTQLTASSLKRNEFIVCAKHYILATGGLEVTRILFLSNGVHPKGMGNDHDLLGRFYLSHITGDACLVKFTPWGGDIVWDYEKTPEGVYFRRTISIRDEAQRNHKLLNLRVTLTHPSVADPQHRSSVLSAAYLIKRFLANRIPPEYNKELSSMTPFHHLQAHLKNILSDPIDLLRFSGKWITKRILSKRKLPSVVLENKSNIYTLHFDAEQSPNRDSRVMLSTEKDIFGLNRLKVDWRFTDADVKSACKSFQLIAKELQLSGAGKMEIELESLARKIKDTGVGSHHIGTTRMSSDPSQGVVDEDCRVHGIDNLYIASSSVFPTSSYANPTLTILALALRLADHIKQLY